MTDVTIVGCGNLGSALIEGLSQSGGHDITAYDVDEETLERVATHATRTTTDVETAAASDVVVVAVKPDVVGPVVSEFGPHLAPEQTVVTVAAGVSRAHVAARTDATVVRVMPNLAASTRDMAAAVAWDDPDEDVREMLTDLGEYVEIEEDLMDAATALNGSGPAFVFYVVQAMKRGAVAEGVDPEAAQVLAAQTVVGAGETVLGVRPERRRPDRRRLLAERHDDRGDGGAVGQHGRGRPGPGAGGGDRALPRTRGGAHR